MFEVSVLKRYRRSYIQWDGKKPSENLRRVGDSLSVHGIAYPDNRVSRLLYNVDVTRQMIIDLRIECTPVRTSTNHQEIANLSCTVSGNQRHSSTLLRWINDWMHDGEIVNANPLPKIDRLSKDEKQLTVQQSHQFVLGHTWTDFDPNRISYATEILDMCTSKLPRTITDP